MKVSYRSAIGIKIMETGFFIAEAHTPQDEAMVKGLREDFEKNRSLFKPIHLFSKNMQMVLQECGDKMIKDEVWNNIGFAQGTIILNDFTYCYSINSNGTQLHDHAVYVFRGGKFIAYSWQNQKADKSLRIVPETSKYLLEHSAPDGEKLWQDTVLNGLYTTLIAAINFLKYAEIQDKIMPAKSREKGIDCKYINETDSEIHYVTSHYINNLYVKGAFKVRGHFRLQPKKKDGEWTKELIWINEFEKQGYTAPARKLKDE
jgi:hypothetical protein